MLLLLSFAAAFCLLLAMAAIGVSLHELDKRLAELAQAMDGRYGTWLTHSAEERRRLKAAKGAREKQPGAPPPRPAVAPTGPVPGKG